MKPILSFSHRARATSYKATRLEKLVTAALPHCLALAKKHNAELATLPAVEITILGTRAMAKVHRDFLGIPGATDVITFPYGEILVCAPVAANRAKEFGHDTTTELALYAIHGLLHLSGHDDTTPAKQNRMTAAQEKILATALTQLTPLTQLSRSMRSKRSTKSPNHA
ncbi:MAG: rRNA maturation RNase YbeY [Spartobacteria bacterium]